MPIPPTTAGSICTSRIWLVSLLALALTACAFPNEGAMRRAPGIESARAVNQLAVSGNACGPAALLNSFRFGSPTWQTTTTAIKGETDRGQLLTIIRGYGLRESPHLGGRLRWNRHGVNVVDLHDIANEIAQRRQLPTIHHEVLIARAGESPAQLLDRTHRRLSRSLAQGLPPILSIRRFVKRGDSQGPDAWQAVEAHFVTLTAVPRRIARGQTNFPIEYIDPWGAAHRHGEIRIPETHVLTTPGTPPPCLEAHFPQANVGKKHVRPGEASVIVVSAVIGRW